ncbi:MAG: hypothetical protein ABFQ82_05345 [Thermodesulfobacteriota bacterium]
MKKTAFAIPLALILLLSVPLSGLADQDCADLLEKNCTSCHYNTRICNKIGKKNKRKWKTSVKRMLRYGLKLDKKTQNTIVDCLVALEKDATLFCKDK